jgi:phenylalanyl-tRNA synthetase beta chain
MKVSRNWIQQYLDFDLPSNDELVKKIGAQLGAVEEVRDLSEQYKGIVIAKVVSCKPHPNADKLKLCLIDDGNTVASVERNTDGYVQVVCGAPNAAEGLFVAWLPPGATVPSTAHDQEPFRLEAREIRGEKSNGMLASAKELAIGDSHDGILILDVQYTSESKKPATDVSFSEALTNYITTPNIKPGDDFAKTYKLDDTIIEIENKMFTHRPDCFGMLGVAREIAGILGHEFRSPDIYRKPKTVPGEDTSKSLIIHNELPELVPRFVAQVFDNVRIGPSPVWMQTMLSRVGIRPISNIVDITNYFMVLTGQPLHAYD